MPCLHLPLRGESPALPPSARKQGQRADVSRRAKAESTLKLSRAGLRRPPAGSACSRGALRLGPDGSPRGRWAAWAPAASLRLESACPQGRLRPRGCTEREPPAQEQARHWDCIISGLRRTRPSFETNQSTSQAFRASAGSTNLFVPQARLTGRVGSSWHLLGTPGRSISPVPSWLPLRTC